MSDEEDLDDKLKVKSPTWRTNSLTQLIRELDERRDAERLSGAKQGIRLKRVAAESPMKRKPSKKVKRRFINEENLYEEREDNDDEGDDNWNYVLFLLLFLSLNPLNTKDVYIRPSLSL